jgi:hypothetical protein
MQYRVAFETHLIRAVTEQDDEVAVDVVAGVEPYFAGDSGEPPSGPTVELIAVRRFDTGELLVVYPEERQALEAEALSEWQRIPVDESERELMPLCNWCGGLGGDEDGGTCGRCNGIGKGDVA